MVDFCWQRNHSTREIKKIKKNTTLETLTRKDSIYNKKFQKIFKDFDIIWAPLNKCDVKNLIKANYKDKERLLEKQEFTKLI